MLLLCFGFLTKSLAITSLSRFLNADAYRTGLKLRNCRKFTVKILLEKQETQGNRICAGETETGVLWRGVVENMFWISLLLFLK